jgi:hypothetical protein
MENSSKHMVSSSNSNKFIKAKDDTDKLKLDVSQRKLKSYRDLDDSIDEEIP